MLPKQPLVLRKIHNLRTSDDSLFDLRFPKENIGKIFFMLAISVSFTLSFQKVPFLQSEGKNLSFNLG
jgi:hypothetical protein